jgi:hypothetical protein
MTEAPAVPFLKGVHPPDEGAKVRGSTSPAVLRAVREARRASNQQRDGLIVVLRCECDRAGCLETVPAIAEMHRAMGERFIVVPDHAGDGMVVGVADRFFVVELHGRGTRFPAPPEPAPPPVAPLGSLRDRKQWPTRVAGGKPIEIVAPDRHCAVLLVSHAAPRFTAEIVSRAPWIVRLHPPLEGGWVPALLELVERWLAAGPIPCAKVLYSGRSYLIRASPGSRLGSPGLGLAL